MKNSIGVFVAGTVAGIALGAAPAFAGETVTLSRIIVAQADRTGGGETQLASPQARETVALTGSNETLPQIAAMDQTDYPWTDRIMGAHGRTLIAVELDSAGKLTKATVIGSSGTRSLDANALSSVKSAKFVPGTLAGVPIGGTYAVSIDFDPEY